MRIRILWLAAVTVLTWLSGIPAQAQTPSAKQVFAFRPSQQGVEIDTPSADQFDQCRIEVERGKGTSGWIVYGPNGETLRRFVDTNGDNVVDQWRYYQHGLEVYRDMDTDKNNKVDQSRWLNIAGTRWGVDADEDGRIDSWKILSAEEASREAVNALIQGDAKRLTPLLVDSSDVRTLGLTKETADKVLEAVSRPEAGLRNVLSKTRIIGPKTEWMRFDSSSPGVIPADAGKASQDLFVYENAMAIVETADKAGLIQLGEMVRVGSVWKFTQIPRPLEGDAVQIAYTGILMEPEAVGTPTTAGGTTITPAVQKLLEALQELDRDAPAPNAGAQALARYNEQRAELLDRLVDASQSAQEREQWMRQMIDGVATAVQTGAYPAGLERLKKIEAETARAQPKSAIVPYASYRRLQAEHTVRLQQAKEEERIEVQKWWLEQLESFAKDNPQSEVAAEALFQLAFTQEVAGQLEDARKWYAELASKHSKTDAGMRAAGALRRLDLKDKTLELAGSGLNGGKIDMRQFRGKVVLVVFWATWCKPCTEDLPRLRETYEQFRGQGFEIVGVNLDATKAPIDGYIRQHRMTWPQIYEEGGLQSAPAQEFGIVSLPTMFLVDKEGKVVSRGISVEDLKTVVPEMLKK